MVTKYVFLMGYTDVDVIFVIFDKTRYYEKGANFYAINYIVIIA